jgi:hypothetical protein
MQKYTTQPSVTTAAPAEAAGLLPCSGRVFFLIKKTSRLTQISVSTALLRPVLNARLQEDQPPPESAARVQVTFPPQVAPGPKTPFAWTIEVVSLILLGTTTFLNSSCFLFA